MKRFFVNISIFSAPIFILAYGFDLFLSNSLKQSNIHAQGEFPTWNAIFDHQLEAEVLINGTSRAWVQISPTIIEDSLKLSCYNLGIDGYSFWLQKMRYELAVSHSKHPKLVIQEVDLLTLAVQEDAYNSDQFLPYLLWNDTMKEYLSKMKGFDFFDFRLPLLRYYGKTDAFKVIFKRLLAPDNNPVERIKGYKGYERTWNNDFDKAKKTMKSYKATIDTTTYDVFYNYLSKLKEQGIVVILTYPPAYFESHNFVENRAEIIQIYQQLSNQLTIPFLDFSNDSLGHSKDYFYNATHLNKKGAELYTRKLVSAIRQIMTPIPTR